MGKVRFSLYLSAILLIAMPTLFVLISDNPFGSTFSQIVISSALIFVISGKSITLFEKVKVGQRFATDIGIIIGLFIVLMLNFLK